MEYKWYTLAVYSGSELKVANEIEKIAKTNDKIKEVFVPIKKVIKTEKGKNTEVLQKLFSNYIFINMIFNRSILDELRAIPKVMGFVGGNPLNPQTVSLVEIERMKKESEKEVILENYKLEIGDQIRIKEGHFESFNGTVEGKDDIKNILKVSIIIFGRTTSIEIEASKVEKI